MLLVERRRALPAGREPISDDSFLDDTAPLGEGESLDLDEDINLDDDFADFEVDDVLDDLKLDDDDDIE